MNRWQRQLKHPNSVLFVPLYQALAVIFLDKSTKGFNVKLTCCLSQDLTLMSGSFMLRRNATRGLLRGNFGDRGLQQRDKVSTPQSAETDTSLEKHNLKNPPKQSYSEIHRCRPWDNPYVCFECL